MKRLRHSVEAFLLKSLASLLRIMPRNMSLAIGETLGGLVYRLGIRREVTLENLSMAFPEWKSSKVDETAFRCYRHFGALLAEFARLPLLKPDNISNLVEVNGWNVLDETLKRGKGGIVVSGHLGNWELMGASAAVKGYPVTYIVTGQQNKQVEDLMDFMRQSAGVNIIKRRDAIKGVLRALKNNQLIAILSDQDAHEAGAFVPFFGRLASAPRGAAMFALKTGASLIFAETFRRGTGSLKVSFELVSTENLPDDHDEAIVELTRRFTVRLEEAVRRHPEQWFWMHRRWKTPSPSVET